jgi:hypothetical protein
MADRLGRMFSGVARLIRGELAQLKLRQMWHLAPKSVVMAKIGGCFDRAPVG